MVTPSIALRLVPSMSSRRGCTCIALSVFLGVAVSVGAQQLPDLPFDARIKVRIVPLGGTQHRGVAYLQHLDADSLHFRFEGASEASAVAWSNVRDLQVSEGVRFRPFSHHAKNVAGVAMFGALFGWASWHGCRDPEESESVECIFVAGRLSSATEGGALIGAGVAVGFALFNLKGEAWRDVPKPEAVRLSARRSGGGVGLGLSIAF